MLKRTTFAAFALLAWSGEAHALVFDASGEASFDAATTWSESFEDPVADAGADAGPGLVISDDADALDGTHVLSLGSFEGQDFSVPVPATAEALRASAWVRGGSIVGTLEARDENGRVDSFAVLFPTGRVTSDGWVEVATRGFSVDPARITELAFGIFAPSEASVDALEVAPDGPAVDEKPCAGVADNAACSGGQVCMWGRCRNVASQVPPMPPEPTKSALAAYLRTRLAALFGPYENRKLDLPNALAEIDGMASAQDAFSYWRHFQVAIHRLHDWHTKGNDVSGFLLSNEKPIGVCFIEGEADLSKSVAPAPAGKLDVLVSHVGTTNTFDLHPGDRLISVDGEHPVEWARSLIGVDSGYWSASNHSTEAEAVSRLAGLIARYADHVEVLRCDAGTKKCATTAETISITDLPPSAPGTSAGISCDNRPILHVPGSSDSHPQGGFVSGIVQESNAQEAIYGLQWSSLNVSGQGGVGPLLESAVADWRAKARGVILDHRTGFGGTNLGPPIIWNLVRTPTPLDVFLFRKRSDDVGPSLLEGKATFDALLSAGKVESAGGPNPDLDLPVALLIHLDGSASDWLPLGMKGAPKAKIFGPYPTAGAFSTLFDFSYWSALGYSIAVGDTIDATGQTRNGFGVEPDVVVLPLQSDLLSGKDTVYDAALSWVRTELKP